MSREYIAQVLKRLRAASGFTANEVGDMIGKSGKTVSAWENNHGQPDAEILIQLCDIYGVDNILDEFRETGEPFKPAAITVDDQRFLDLLHRLNQSGRDRVMETLTDLVQLPKYTETSLPKEA